MNQETNTKVAPSMDAAEKLRISQERLHSVMAFQSNAEQDD